MLDSSDSRMTYTRARTYTPHTYAHTVRSECGVTRAGVPTGVTQAALCWTMSRCRQRSGCPDSGGAGRQLRLLCPPSGSALFPPSPPNPIPLSLLPSSPPSAIPRVREREMRDKGREKDRKKKKKRERERERERERAVCLCLCLCLCPCLCVCIS